MGMRVTNITEVIQAFQLTDRLVNQEARDVLKRGALNIKTTAREFAPVLEHRIEKAIKILPSQGNQYSLRITIAVTGNINGKVVDSYAAEVHEYPWHRRGVFTRLKGPKAGPRYLSRAVEARKKEILDGLAAAMNTGISQAISKSGVNRKKRR